MKGFKKFASLLAAAALLAVLPGGSALTASAQSPTTYCVFYDSDDDAWYYQKDTSTYNNQIEQKESFQLKDVIQEGDIVVVEGASSGSGLSLDLSNVRLSNLTLKETKTVVISAKSVDECYVLDGTVGAVNGDVTNAYVYGSSSITFNNSISNLKIIGTTDVHAYVTAGGTVSHVIAVDDIKTHYEYFNVAFGKLEIEDGGLVTDSAYYSKTASSPASAPAPSAAPAAPAASNSAASEYDDVPKTGEGAPIVLWMMGIAAVCFAGKAVLKRA